MENWIYNHGPLVLQAVVILLLTLFSALLIRKTGDRILRRLIAREHFDPTSFRFAQHFITAVIIIVGFSLIIFKIPGLRHVATTLITGAGILAVVVGFASQAALSNIVSGIFIVIFKPYRINDIITIKDTLSGTVEDISLRHTVIRNFENRRIVIPNSVISNEVVVNANLVEDKICKWVEFGISYNSDIDQARRIVQEVCAAHPNFIDARTNDDIEKGLPAVRVKVLRFGESSIDMRAWVWAENSPKAFDMGCDVLETLKKRFENEGIEIPFPYRNLIVREMPKDLKP